MNGWLALVPLIAALLGWCVHRIAVEAFLRRMFPSGQGRGSGYQVEIAARLGAVVRNALLSSGDLERQVADPNNLRKMMPEIEGHIDQFLRVKLPQSMPVIGMFVGDRTIGQLKEVFLKELETLFPVIMNGYLQQLQKDADPSAYILNKLEAFPGERTRQAVRNGFAQEIRRVALLGAFSGFIIGMVQVLLWMFFEA